MFEFGGKSPRFLFWSTTSGLDLFENEKLSPTVDVEFTHLLP